MLRRSVFKHRTRAAVVSSGAFRIASAIALTSVLGTGACDEPEAPQPLKNAELKLESASPPAEDSPPDKAKTAPTFEVDESSAKLGYSRYLVDRADGLEKLRTALEAHKAHIDGKDVVLTIDRQAKLTWVTTYLKELEAVGARAFEIKTPTRADYPKSVRFTATDEVAELPACTPVSTIQEDRTTVTWKLGGGAQSRRGRGLGGPDLSTTGLSIARLAKACPKSDAVAVGAHESVNWGLVYDLAASTNRIEDTSFNRRVLLLTEPKPGKAVKL